jgi:SAM-dependent methyltransferase
VLHCPHCGQDLRSPKSAFTILTCSCGTYPVVAGIPIFRKGMFGPNGVTPEKLVWMIARGKHRSTLLELVMPASPSLVPPELQALPVFRGKSKLLRIGQAFGRFQWVREAAKVLMDTEDRTACDLMRFHLLRFDPKPDSFDYFAYRFGQPRHLVALSFASTIRHPQQPLLDLACGYGHLTQHLIHRANGQPVVGIDRDFFSLYVAKHWIAPEAQYVCTDVTQGLPFEDGTFAVSMCTDAFHLFTDKQVVMKELNRVTVGTIILVTVRNGNVPYRYARFPLTPKEYADLVGRSHRIVGDADVLSRYLQKKGPMLSRQPGLDELSSTSPLSIIVADKFEDYGSFSQWLHGEVGTLSLNPLFRLEGNTLRRTFPTPWYEEDNDACKRYLPESVTVSPNVLEDVWRGRRTPNVEPLIDQFVVLGLPHRFGHPNAPVRQILEWARRDSLAVSSKKMAKATGKVRTPNAY